MVSVQKWPLFQTFFLSNIGQVNVFYDILQPRNSFQGYKNKKLRKSKNSHFYKGLTNGFCPKMTIIPTCFLRQYRQGKCLSRYSITKKAYLGYKNKKFKKSRNWHFSKGVNVSFWSKNRHFSKLCFLGNIGQENVSYDILQRKNSFLGDKNKNFKK